jgi:hypothetical protein
VSVIAHAFLSVLPLSRCCLTGYKRALHPVIVLSPSPLRRTLFNVYKTDASLPWENRKPLTQAVLAEGAAQGSKWTATLGPTTLRRTTGPGMNPVSALFMAEVARASTLTPAQLTANGRTVALDMDKMRDYDDDDLESLPVRALSSVHGGAGGGNRASTSYPGGERFSQFLPNRPDDHQTMSPSSPAHSGAQLNLAAKAGGGISRPDHLITGAGGAGGAAGLTGGAKSRAHSHLTKSTAATLLSAGHRSESADSGGAAKGGAGAGVRPAQAVPRRSLESAGSGEGGHGGAHNHQAKKLFNKMASFFQR